MNKFNSIKDFVIIKCEAKACNDALRELHHKANEIIYNHSQQYAFPRNVQTVMDDLTNTFLEIKGLEVPHTTKAKKEEILQKGREMIRSLRQYKQHFKYDDSCVGGIEAMCKFQLHKYLSSKNALSVEEGAEYLRSNKILKEIAEDVEQKLNVKPKINAFLRMQNEIIELLEDKLRGYAFAS